jgi:predicted Zn-dependent protease with MMP-like domain
MNDEDFAALVEAGIKALSENVRRRLKNVVIRIADEPSRADREALGMTHEDQLFGLYEGVPQTERGLDGEPLLPDVITIYKLPILAAYNDPDEVAACVANTVWHEVAHHFGMDEDEVEAEEIRRGKCL